MFSYLFFSLPEEINTGCARINEKYHLTVGDAVEYIAQRHSLIFGIQMKTKGSDYLVQMYDDPYVQTKNFVDIYPHIRLLDSPLNEIKKYMGSYTIILFDGITHFPLHSTDWACRDICDMQ